jgi:hypothetical protein
MHTNLSTQKKSNPAPAALVIFDRGLDQAPLIVPNGGSSELDDEIVRLIRSNFLNTRKAAA